MFKQFDTNGKGVLTQTKFRKALETLGFKLDINVLRQIFTLFDDDGNDRVDFNEFGEGVRGSRGGFSLLSMHLCAHTTPIFIPFSSPLSSREKPTSRASAMLPRANDNTLSSTPLTPLPCPPPQSSLWRMGICPILSNTRPSLPERSQPGAVFDVHL